MASIRLGDLLVKAKVLTEAQLKSALAEQAKWGGKLGDLLVRMGYLTEELLVKALAKQLGVVAVDLDAIVSLPPHVKMKVPVELAVRLLALPLQLRDEGKTLVVAMAEPQNLQQLEDLRAASRCRVLAQIAGKQALARAFTRLYEEEGEFAEVEGSFKLIDSQGHTLIKKLPDLPPPQGRPTSPPPLSSPSPVPSGPPAPASSGSGVGRSASEQLKAVEEAQRKEVAVIKAVVDLLIDKGIFTRDEYLAKVKR